MGTWGKSFYCPEDTYVFSFSLRLDEDKLTVDQTGLNGIRLYCIDLEFKRNEERKPGDGPFGDFKAATVCGN